MFAILTNNRMGVNIDTLLNNIQYLEALCIDDHD